MSWYLISKYNVQPTPRLHWCSIPESCSSVRNEQKWCGVGGMIIQTSVTGERIGMENLSASQPYCLSWMSEWICSVLPAQLAQLSPIVAARDGGMGWLRRTRGNTHHHSAENVCSSTVACKPMPINPTNNLGKALYCLENDSNLQSRVKKKTNKLQGLLAFMNDPYT